MNTREAAMKTLYEIEYNGAFSNMAVKETLRAVKMSERDRGFYTRLVYGVIDKKLTLNYVIGRFSKIKTKKISKYILIILQMGVYQLLYMDSVPSGAAVNESVKLAKRYGHSASVGFVNGVLRAVSGGTIEYPKEGTEYLEVRYSVPRELCEKWTADFGFEFTEELLRSLEKEPELLLRPNILKTDAASLTEALNKEGVRAENRGEYVGAEGFDIENDALYKRGMYTVQDFAAMRAAAVLAPRSGDTVIDMCAAPGGKTTHMAELMGNKGRIYAFDIYEHKTELVRKNAERLGITIVEARTRDSSVYDETLRETADKILCDAPCSGTGIIRRKPEIKYTNRAGGAELTKTQTALLGCAAEYLKRGGELVYSTCSIEREENEGVTGDFLSRNGGFEKIYEKTLYPHIDGCDGFYICKLRKLL